LPDFDLIPLVFGLADEACVAEELNRWVSPSTLFIASSDLSHYHDYEQAVRLDRATIDSILQLDAPAVCEAEACGHSPVTALIHLARAHHWQPRLFSYQNSGDTSGDRSRVVGYAAIGFYSST
jgi:hypothetical protein